MAIRRYLGRYAAKSSTLEDLVKERFGPVTEIEVGRFTLGHRTPGASFGEQADIILSIKDGYDAGVLDVRGDKVSMAEWGERPWAKETMEKEGFGELWEGK